MLNQVVHKVTARPPNINAFYCDSLLVNIFILLSQKPKQTEKHVNILTLGLQLIRLKMVRKKKQPLYRPWNGNRHMTVIRLSSLRLGLLYCQEILLVLISERDSVKPRAFVQPEVLFQWQNPISNSRSSGLKRSVSTNCATGYLKSGPPKSETKITSIQARLSVTDSHNIVDGDPGFLAFAWQVFWIP